MSSANAIVLAAGLAGCMAREPARETASVAPDADSASTDSEIVLADFLATRAPVALAGVTRLSDTEYTITAAALDHQLGSTNELMSGTRIVPSYHDGKVDGMKLFGVKPDSALALLGLANGDVIARINGVDVSKPEAARDVYTRLQKSSQVRADLERDGKNITLHYTVLR